jgi:hypothetical protein
MLLAVCDQALDSSAEFAAWISTMSPDADQLRENTGFSKPSTILTTAF